MFTKHGKEEKRRPVVAALVTLGLTAATIAVTTTPASAETTGNTPVTFTLAATGGLTISVPAAAVVLSGGTRQPGGTATGALGGVTVNDQTSDLLGWSVSITSVGGLKTDDGGPGETIGAANITYNPGEVAKTGTAVVVGTPTDALGILPAVTATAVVGDNTASWDPVVTVNIPSGNVVGVYSGTITHSVS